MQGNLNPESRGVKNIDRARLNLLQIPRGDFRSAGQFILRHANPWRSARCVRIAGGSWRQRQKLKRQHRWKFPNLKNRVTTFPKINRRDWIALWAQDRRRQRIRAAQVTLLPAPVLRAAYPDLLQWDWDDPNPYQWNVYVSLDGGATFSMPEDYWVSVIRFLLLTGAATEAAGHGEHQKCLA